MSRYKLTIVCEFDENYPLSVHTEEARALILHCCPQEFGLKALKAKDSYCIETSYCSKAGCRECWFKALKEGVRADAAENVHVERLG